MKNKPIRTYPIKPLTIFLAICFVVSAGLLTLFCLPFMWNELLVIRILIYFFCGVFTIASLIVLIYQIFFYVSIEDELFVRHYLFGKSSVKISNIDEILNRDGFYIVVVKGKRFATFATNTKEASQIVVYLEKYHVNINW